VEIHEGTSRSGGALCVSPINRHPSSECSGAVETLEFATAPNVVRVRVRLSNGRSAGIDVIRIPTADGGPAGVLIAAFRGDHPYPVSAQELAGDGTTLRTIALGGVRCRREPPSLAPRPPELVTLATTTSPSGEPLTISAILHKFRGQTEFFPESGPGEHQSESSQASKAQFKWQLSSQCAPRAYALLDGVLLPPAASVLARTRQGLAPLTKVDLPASDNAEGPFFYGVFASVPSELIVQRADGSTLYTESLAAKATEEAEYCEGYGEA
jgi:hypothetical protein